MSDSVKTIVYDFLNQCDIVISEYKYYTDSSYIIKNDKSVFIKYSVFEKEFKLIYGASNLFILNEWFKKIVKDKELELEGTIKKLNNQYELKLGRANWVIIDKKGIEVNEKIVKKEFIDLLTPFFKSKENINSMFKKWYEYEVIKKTEEICGL